MEKQELTAEEAFLEVARTYLIMARSDRLNEFDPIADLRDAGFELMPTNDEKRAGFSDREAFVEAAKMYMAYTNHLRIQRWLADRGFMLRALSPDPDVAEADVQNEGTLSHGR